MSSNSRKQLEAWLNNIEVTGNILDIGGSQNPIFNRIKFDKNTKFTIMDLAQPHENKQQPDIVADINELYEKRNEQKYDVVFMIEVSEYLYDPMRAFQNVWYELKKDGVFYLSTHWLYGYHNPKGFDYLRYSKDGIEKLLKDAGFEIEYVKPRFMSDHSRNLLYSFYKSEGMRMLYDEPETYHSGHMIKAIKK